MKTISVEPRYRQADARVRHAAGGDLTVAEDGRPGGLESPRSVRGPEAPPPLRYEPQALARYCRERAIRRLGVFGSVLRPDFDAGRSDVDVLVEFAPGAVPGFRFFGYGRELGEIFGRPADVNTPAMLSPHFRDEVLREAVTLYEQA